MARDKYEVNENEKSGFMSFIYNSRTGECLGRTGKSWFLILVFYIIYYSLLAGFFVGMLSVFFTAFISDDQPKLTGAQSLLRGNPGLSFLPKPDVDSTIVKASTMNGSDYFNSYMSEMKGVFKDYNETIIGNQVDCKAGAEQDIKKACFFDKTILGKCADPEAVLLSGSICVYAKMNKIYGWLPEITSDKNNNNTLISCSEQNPGDKENMGTVFYYPSVKFEGKDYGYIDSKFFPFLKQDDYMTPIVGVELRGVKKNVIVLVKCELMNIKFSTLAPKGAGTFEVFVGTN